MKKQYPQKTMTPHQSDVELSKSSLLNPMSSLYPKSKTDIEQIKMNIP